MKEKELIVSERDSLGYIIPLIITLIGFFIIIGCLSASNFDYWFYGGFESFLSWSGTILFIFGIISMIYFAGYELHVTNQRVYGKAGFGVLVDIPIDSISSVGQIAFLKSVRVGSSSLKIKFYWLKNSQKIKDKITELILLRSNINSK